MVLKKSIKEYCEECKEELRYQFTRYMGTPTLAVIQIGNDEASTRYIRNKKKDCEEVGINFEWYYYEDTITTPQLLDEIHDLQPHVNGIIVQMPIPNHLDLEAITYEIDKLKDVDGFKKDSFFDPCTPKGIIDYLKKGCEYDLTGKNVVVIGRSDIVGKPLARMLTEKDATVTLCHSRTVGLGNYLANADLVICAVGKEKFLNCYPLHDVAVIDVGINFDENGKLVGDCYNTEGRDVTPVPGGVGLLTRIALLQNMETATFYTMERDVLR